MNQQEVFNADVARFDEAFRKADAIRTDDDGFQWIDATKVSPGLLNAYERFRQYGYATGLMP
jgi:hypothetical protein